MNDNKSAFRSDEYDRKIKQTLPYYDEFYEQPHPITVYTNGGINSVGTISHSKSQAPETSLRAP